MCNYFLIIGISGYVFMMKTKPRAFWTAEKISIINFQNNFLLCEDLNIDI